jgi:hypothetical protein
MSEVLRALNRFKLPSDVTITDRSKAVYIPPCVPSHTSYVRIDTCFEC